jgi:hypothetical protein
LRMPLESYDWTNASVPPELAWPGRAPSVGPPQTRRKDRQKYRELGHLPRIQTVASSKAAHRRAAPPAIRMLHPSLDEPDLLLRDVEHRRSGDAGPPGDGRQVVLTGDGRLCDLIGSHWYGSRIRRVDTP